jgi:hypothetical protein
MAAALVLRAATRNLRICPVSVVRWDQRMDVWPVVARWLGDVVRPYRQTTQCGAPGAGAGLVGASPEPPALGTPAPRFALLARGVGRRSITHLVDLGGPVVCVAQAPSRCGNDCGWRGANGFGGRRGWHGAYSGYPGRGVRLLDACRERLRSSRVDEFI